VIPSSGTPGNEYDVLIKCTGITLAPGKTSVDFGSDVSVKSVNVTGAESVIAHILIDKNAKDERHDVTIKSAANEVSGPMAFNVISTGSTFYAELDILPVQKVSVSDFDRNNAANAPLLFTIRLYNDQKARSIKAVLHVIGQTYGELGTATKTMSLTPSATAQFDNRQFDDYKLGSSGSVVVQKSFQTGVLPSDVYTYKLEVFSGGKLIATAEEKNVISDVQYKPELISPGADFSSPMEEVTTKQPLFQWFAQMNSYDLYIYKLRGEDVSAQEATLSKPVYVQKNIHTTSFLYPNSAALLQDNTLYAWQIVAHSSDPYGNNEQASDLFRFKTKQTGTNEANRVSSLKITPDDSYIPVNTSAKFVVTALDDQDRELSVKPTMKVVPSTAGTIDANGNFTASGTPERAAIVAQYGETQDYVTVQIVNKPADGQPMQGFLKLLFGLPDPK
jgi:hypothetical protein